MYTEVPILDFATPIGSDRYRAKREHFRSQRDTFIPTHPSQTPLLTPSVSRGDQISSKKGDPVFQAPRPAPLFHSFFCVQHASSSLEYPIRVCYLGTDINW